MDNVILKYQNKQIVYSKFIPRLFSTLLDLSVITFIASPILNYLSLKIVKIYFYDYFLLQDVDIHNNVEIYNSMMLPEFYNYIITTGLLFKYTLTLLGMVGLLMSFYFVGFWYYFGATPGKMILKMKIVDSDTYSKPSLQQLTKRYLGYSISFIGIWSIIASSKGQALHDKISSTVVIKS